MSSSVPPARRSTTNWSNCIRVRERSWWRCNFCSASLTVAQPNSASLDDCSARVCCSVCSISVNRRSRSCRRISARSRAAAVLRSCHPPSTAAPSPTASIMLPAARRPARASSPPARASPAPTTASTFHAPGAAGRPGSGCVGEHFTQAGQLRADAICGGGARGQTALLFLEGGHLVVKRPQHSGIFGERFGPLLHPADVLFQSPDGCGDVLPASADDPAELLGDAVQVDALQLRLGDLRGRVEQVLGDQAQLRGDAFLHNLVLVPGAAQFVLQGDFAGREVLAQHEPLSFDLELQLQDRRLLCSPTAELVAKFRRGRRGIAIQHSVNRRPQRRLARLVGADDHVHARGKLEGVVRQAQEPPGAEPPQDHERTSRPCSNATPTWSASSSVGRCSSLASARRVCISRTKRPSTLSFGRRPNCSSSSQRCTLDCTRRRKKRSAYSRSTAVAFTTRSTGTTPVRSTSHTASGSLASSSALRNAASSPAPASISSRLY